MTQTCFITDHMA